MRWSRLALPVGIASLFGIAPILVGPRPVPLPPPSSASSADGRLSVQVRTEDRETIKVDIQVQAPHAAPRRSVLLAIDRSASMGEDDGLPLSRARVAARLLVERLGDHELLAVVSYADRPLIEVQPTTLIRQRHLIRRRIDDLRAGGATELSHVLTLAGMAWTPEPGKRVVVLTDGVSSIGPQAFSRLLHQARDWKKTGLPLAFLDVGQRRDPRLARIAEAAGAVHLHVPAGRPVGDFIDDLLPPEPVPLATLGLRPSDPVELLGSTGAPLQPDDVGWKAVGTGSWAQSLSFRAGARPVALDVNLQGDHRDPLRVVLPASPGQTGTWAGVLNDPRSSR